MPIIAADHPGDTVVTPGDGGSVSIDPDVHGRHAWDCDHRAELVRAGVVGETRTTLRVRSAFSSPRVGILAVVLAVVGFLLAGAALVLLLR